METFIRDKVAVCDRCIRRKAIPQSASLVNITTSAPMEMICSDYLSLERSKGGFENVLVITDHFTRYAQAYPTTNQTAKTTARVLFEKFVVHYGFPERIHSDRGANFMSNLISELCHLGGVNQSRTTPYHAMGNGMVERFNQTLLKMLGTLEEDKKSNWKDYVGPMVHAYNATVHDSTGYSPYYLMFGRHPRLAIDALLGLHFEDVNARYANEYTRKLHKRLTTSYQKAKEMASKTAEMNKHKYDFKVRAAKLIPGDLVLVRNVTLRGKQKIADRWENEPYIVVSQPNVDIPVYDVKRNNPRARRIRRLHRNLILPLGVQNENLPEKDSRTTGPTPKYVIPQRRRNVSLADDDGGSETTPALRRSTRIRRPPKQFFSS
jgi:transposase InsO family protein